MFTVYQSLIESALWKKNVESTRYMNVPGVSFLHGSKHFCESVYWTTNQWIVGWKKNNFFWKNYLFIIHTISDLHGHKQSGQLYAILLQFQSYDPETRIDLTIYDHICWLWKRASHVLLSTIATCLLECFEICLCVAPLVQHSDLFSQQCLNTLSSGTLPTNCLLLFFHLI